MFHKIDHTKKNLSQKSFLVYGLGASGVSVLNYLKKKKFTKFYVWDDNAKLRKKFFSKDTKNLKSIIKFVDYIVLSPGISLRKTKHKKLLARYKMKIITDIDLLYLSNFKFKSIVVTGSNGKSTTCKIISHLLKVNKFKVKLGGNIGTPVLNLKIKNNDYLVIEASSFQLAHSKHINPEYGILLNISNDHVDWHGSMQSYINSKFRLFRLQKKNDYAFINDNLKKIYKKNGYLGKLISIKNKNNRKITSKVDNEYLRSYANIENLNFVYSLAKILNISKNSFFKSINTFKGLPHRHEIFLKKRNITFINDSKATTLQAAKYALASNKNIYWIVGGLPKYKDKINLSSLKKNIVKSYIIGKDIRFFKKLLKNKIKFSVSKNIKTAIIKILRDIRSSTIKKNTIILCPGAASFDQFKNFEIRGEKFKKLSKFYAKKFL